METSNRRPNISCQKHEKNQRPIYENKADLKNAKGCCHYDSSFSNLDPPVNLQEKYTRRDLTHGHKSNEPQIQWSRNNIAMTMEYFQPISSPSTPVKRSSYGNQTDYSYAYYEPGAAMRHSNIPKSDDLCGGPSTRSSPKSMRALLSKPKDDIKKTNNRHTYTTRYGTQENIYEDISSIGTGLDLESSARSLSEEDCSKSEFQDILHNHYRVLEELNLSVEELLLPTTTKTIFLSPKRNPKRTTRPRKIKNYKKLSPKHDICTSMNELVICEDSGFSGSSSGASYIGSLRNYKTALTRSLRTSTAVTTSEENGFVSQKNSLQMKNRCKEEKSTGPLKNLKLSLWNKR